MGVTYDYPRPMVTVDIFLLRIHHDEMQILLIQRG
ncbi:MAG: NUDIX hydrolase, partial [Calditrichaeota bacterium]